MQNNELFQKITTLPRRVQDFALAILAHGPVTTQQLGKHCSCSPNSTYSAVSQLRSSLLPEACIERSSKGYTIRLTTAEERAAHTAARRTVATTPAAAPAAPPVAAPETKRSSDAETPKPTFVRHFYRLPWGGGVDLDSIVGVHAERGSVVIQQRGGGFMRSPTLSDPEQVAESITNAACGLPNVNVVN